MTATKKRAYISVYNKEGVVEFCRYLTEYGYELIATEGTHKVLTEAGLHALYAHELTGYPEPLGGKVRALHPAIYTGIIAGQLTSEQLAELDEKDIYPIQMVVINLYPFKEDMEAGVPFEEAAGHIDAGGVALIDAAAKNFNNTVVVCDPADYERVLCNLAAGAVTEDERKYFMYKAFSYTAYYNALVSQYLSRQLDIPFPQALTAAYEKSQDVRYGENPHQRAAIYREPLLREGSLARAKQLSGPTLTYNAVNDANAALELVKEYDMPAVVACKHHAPSSAGVGDSLFEAYMRAYEADPISFRRGILAFNGIVDARIAAHLARTGTELAMAVGFTPEAMAELAYDENIILLEMPDIRSKVQFATYDVQKVYGGLLIQTYDQLSGKNSRCVTGRKPTESEIRALSFNYKVAKHVRSSAMVVGRENMTAGIGAGQPCREIALRVALMLAGDASGCVLASDADISSVEIIEACHEAGITAIIQTGNEDKSLIELCDRYGIAMLFTDERHFKN